MSFSLGEFEALCRKASRGAGLDWGTADEAARAARRLASFGLPVAEMLASRLTRLDEAGALTTRYAPQSVGSEWAGEEGLLCPILTGSRLSDEAWQWGRGDCDARCRADGASEADTSRQQTIRNVLTPLLLVPFAGLVARQIGVAVLVRWGAVAMIDDGVSLSLEGPRAALLDESASEVCCERTNLTSVPAETALVSVKRAEPPLQSLEQLEAFSQRTYAPATEESRLRGAG